MNIGDFHQRKIKAKGVPISMESYSPPFYKIIGKGVPIHFTFNEHTPHLFIVFMMRTLQLFNAVLKKDSGKEPFISTEGFVIESGALWAKNQIVKYYSKEKLKGNDLNRTFHKSWKKIKETGRTDLLLEQIRHYISTYGSEFQNEIYIPAEILNVPESTNRCHSIGWSLN